LFLFSGREWSVQFSERNYRHPKVVTTLSQFATLVKRRVSFQLEQISGKITINNSVGFL